jgi:hypothetical protein
MRKKQTIVVIAVLALILIIGSVLYFVSRPNDKCTPKDREQNNCVPAGRCTPPGDPREGTIDCQIKGYEHKFNQGE